MEITGQSSEFPLPELFQFLDRRQVTGCLSLKIFSDHYEELKPQQFDVWLNQGQIIALKRGNHKQDIYDLAVGKEWMSPFAARKLKQRAPQEQAAGLYLESQGVLSFGQLRSLFFSEVVHRVASFCNANNVVFNFHTTTDFPIADMTGFRMTASQIASQGIQRLYFKNSTTIAA